MIGMQMGVRQYQTQALVEPRVRWIETREDKRHRRACFSCGVRKDRGWELRREKDHGMSGVVVCDDCYDEWTSGIMVEEIR